MEKENKKSIEEMLEGILKAPDEPEVYCNPESWEAVNQILDEMLQYGSEIRKICRKEARLISYSPYLALEPYLRQEYFETLSTALVRLEEMLYLHTNVTTFDRAKLNAFFSASKGKNAAPVLIHVEKNRIFIKMPYLPRKYNGAKDICNQLLSVKLFSLKDFPVWAEWNAKYYHVFPTSIKEIPKDVDNYEYKRTNDILAYALGSSDNAFRFSMSMTAVFTDDIAPGTYIEVTPKSSENIENLISVFGQQEGPNKEITKEENPSS